MDTLGSEVKSSSVAGTVRNIGRTIDSTITTNDLKAVLVMGGLAGITVAIRKWAGPPPKESFPSCGSSTDNAPNAPEISRTVYARGRCS